MSTKTPLRDKLPVASILPIEARLRLVKASGVGKAESLARQEAVDSATRWVQDTYPQFFVEEA